MSPAERYPFSTLSIVFLKALEADLGLALVEKCVQNMISYRIGVAVRKIDRSDHGGAWRPCAAAPLTGACGGVSAGGHHRCVTFFNTVVLTYYTHILDELGK